MAVTVLKTVHGNSTGLETARFNVVIQLGYNGTTTKGYKMYVRYFVRVTESTHTSNFTNNLHCSWTDTTYGLSKEGDYAISDWESLGTISYGSKVTASANCYYTAYSGTVRKSSATAKYTVPQKTYTVTYNANGGSGKPSNQTKTHGVGLTLSSTEPTRTGYTFLGWGTSSTDTTVDFSPGGTYGADVDITLYAIWRINTYIITYILKGGSGAPSEQTKRHGVALTLPTPTREDYIFLGWATHWSQTSPVYLGGDSYTNNASITLYALWKLDYTKPRITNFAIWRVDADGNASDEGTYAKMSFDWITDKEGTSCRIYYKRADQDDYIACPSYDLGDTSGSFGAIIDDENGNVVFDTEYPYGIKLNVADSYGYNYQELVLHATFLTFDVTPDGKNMTFGKASQDDEDEVLRFAYKTVDIAPKENLLYQGKQFFGQTLLWSGSLLMSGNHTITLTKKVSETKNGLLLLFGRDGDYNLMSHFVPKANVMSLGRTSWNFFLCTQLFDYVGSKTLYISDDKIEGHDKNWATATNSISGITYHNEAFTLRCVFEV